jgi:hypothetical protein
VPKKRHDGRRTDATMIPAWTQLIVTLCYNNLVSNKYNYIHMYTYIYIKICTKHIYTSTWVSATAASEAMIRCIHICIQLYLYIHVSVYIYTIIYTSKYIYIHIFLYIYIYTCIYIYIYTYTNTYILKTYPYLYIHLNRCFGSSC